VNNITFACLTVRYGLHIMLLAFAPKLHEIIDRFVKFQEERNYVVNDEVGYINFITNVKTVTHIYFFLFNVVIVCVTRRR